MPDTATLRRTSVYSLRVAQDRTGSDAALDVLAAQVHDTGAVVTDTHAAKQGGTPYVSISFRIPSSDVDALALASALLDAAELTDAEAYLHTGLGVHRRVLAGLSA